jgi:hypothetical protein
MSALSPLRGNSRHTGILQIINDRCPRIRVRLPLLQQSLHLLHLLWGDDGPRERDEGVPDLRGGEVQGWGVKVVRLVLEELFSFVASSVPLI